MSTVTAVPLLPVKRAYLVWLWLGLAIALIAGVALAKAGDTGIRTTPSGLRYRVIAPGSGAAHPTDADVALVNYVGKLPDGTVFDQSQQPTPLPVSGMIKGFSEGLKLMPKGAKYRFWIAPELGYGAEAKGPIPANSTLVFDVELVDFIPEATLRALQQQQQMMGAPGAMPPGAMPPGAVPPGAPSGR